MRWTKPGPRRGMVILTAVLAALLISACGGSSNSAKTTTSKNAAATSTSRTALGIRSAFASCLKQHGVTLPARRGDFGFHRNGTTTTGGGTPPAGGYPGSGGSGFPGGGGGFPGAGGFAGGNSKFAKAFAACRSKLGGAGFGSGRFGQGAGARRFTPHFTTAALKSYVACMRRNGDTSMPEPNSASRTPFPRSAETNPKFPAANAKCERVLFRQAFRGTIAPGRSTITTATSTTAGA